MVVDNGGGGEMEPMAPVVAIDGGDGSHCRQRSSLMEVAVGWSRRRRMSSLTVALAIFVNDGRRRQRRQWDGSNGGLALRCWRQPNVL